MQIKKGFRKLIISLLLAVLLTAARLDTVHAIPSFTEKIIDSASDGTPDTSWGKGVGDLDGDGDPDLLVGANAGGGLVWYENPLWTQHTIASSGAFSTDIEVLDLDGDGDRDVVTNVGYTTRWYRNSNNGLSWSTITISNRTMHDVEIADMNGDGRWDAVTRNQTEWSGNGNALYIQLQGSGGTFTEQGRSDLPHGEGLLVRDVDRDGDKDIIINTLWLENPGGTSNFANWTKRYYASSWHSNTYIDACDMNNDGYLDILLAPSELEDQYYRVSYFRAPADPRSSSWTEITVDSNTEAVLHYIGCADFDGDGDKDISTAEMSQSVDPDEVRIYENLGTHTSFTKRVINTRGSHSMRIVDIDRDGDTDLFGSNQPGVQPVILLINQSVPSTTTPTHFPTNTPTRIPTNTPTRTPSNTPPPTPAFLPGDINKDGTVNLQDYLLLSGAFGTNNQVADINKDNTVNILDFAILSANFGSNI